MVRKTNNSNKKDRDDEADKQKQQAADKGREEGKTPRRISRTDREIMGLPLVNSCMYFNGWSARIL